MTSNSAHVIRLPCTASAREPVPHAPGSIWILRYLPERSILWRSRDTPSPPDRAKLPLRAVPAKAFGVPPAGIRLLRVRPPDHRSGSQPTTALRVQAVDLQWNP